VRTNASQSEPWPGLRELDPAAFGADLDALMRVYQAAMGVAAVQLPGRRAIMEAHAANPGFRGLAVTAPPGVVTALSGAATAAPGPATAPPGPATAAHRPATAPPGPATAPPGPATAAPGPSQGPSPGRSPGPSPGDVIAFAYGFHGGSGQWWHDLVRSTLISRSGYDAAIEWLDDSFEVAEVHVRPEYQRRGIGKRMLYRLTGGRAERTAVLSTMDTNSPARRLYRSLGFTDLLTGYRFSGAPVPYAVMGAALPLLTTRS
jgi:GNAT superfamily N-acetyltransferase